MRVNIRAVVAAAVIAALFSGVGFGQASRDSKPPSITVAEAHQLVYALLDADDWTKLPGFAIEKLYISPTFPGFYEIHATWDNPGGGNSVGRYAVAEATGDVWDSVMCGRFTSPALLKAQEVLRKRIGLTEAEYRKLRKPGPGCEPDQAPQVMRMGRPMWGLPKPLEKRK